MRILWLAGVVVGAFMIIKTEWLIENFGKSAWAEEHMGAEGGSRLMYKLVGLAVIIVSFMGMTGMLGGVIIKFFGRFFRVLG